MLPLSATYTLYAASIASATGALKLAAEPAPLAKPGERLLPASVVTAPLPMVTRRSCWPYSSDTTRYAPAASTASPMG